MKINLKVGENGIITKNNV